MDFDEHNSYSDFEIGDIVGESEYIVPPGRAPWVGECEDLIAVHWLKPDTTEALPASVIRIVQKARKKQKKILDTL